MVPAMGRAKMLFLATSVAVYWYFFATPARAQSVQHKVFPRRATTCDQDFGQQAKGWFFDGQKCEYCGHDCHQCAAQDVCAACDVGYDVDWPFYTLQEYYDYLKALDVQREAKQRIDQRKSELEDVLSYSECAMTCAKPVCVGTVQLDCYMTCQDHNVTTCFTECANRTDHCVQVCNTQRISNCTQNITNIDKCRLNCTTNCQASCTYAFGRSADDCTVQDSPTGGDPIINCTNATTQLMPFEEERTNVVTWVETLSKVREENYTLLFQGAKGNTTCQPMNCSQVNTTICPSTCYNYTVSKMYTNCTNDFTAPCLVTQRVERSNNCTTLVPRQCVYQCYQDCATQYGKIVNSTINCTTEDIVAPQNCTIALPNNTIAYNSSLFNWQKPVSLCRQGAPNSASTCFWKSNYTRYGMEDRDQHAITCRPNAVLYGHVCVYTPHCERYDKYSHCVNCSKGYYLDHKYQCRACVNHFRKLLRAAGVNLHTLIDGAPASLEDACLACTGALSCTQCHVGTFLAYENPVPYNSVYGNATLANLSASVFAQLLYEPSHIAFCVPCLDGCNCTNITNLCTSCVSAHSYFDRATNSCKTCTDTVNASSPLYLCSQCLDNQTCTACLTHINGDPSRPVFGRVLNASAPIANYTCKPCTNAWQSTFIARPNDPKTYNVSRYRLNVDVPGDASCLKCTDGLYQYPGADEDMKGRTAICTQCDNGYAESAQKFNLVTVDNADQAKYPWQITYEDVQFTFCRSCQTLIAEYDAMLNLKYEQNIDRARFVRRCRRISTPPDRYLITQCGVDLTDVGPYPNTRAADVSTVAVTNAEHRMRGPSVDYDYYAQNREYPDICIYYYGETERSVGCKNGPGKMSVYLVNTTDIGPTCIPNIYFCRTIARGAYLNRTKTSTAPADMGISVYPRCASCFTNYPQAVYVGGVKTVRVLDFVLTKSGKCVLCSEEKAGAGCLACAGDQTATPELDKIICTQCATNRSLEYYSDVESDYPINYYLSRKDGTCVACPRGCQECQVAVRSICPRCQNGWRLFGSQCERCTIPYCAQCEGTGDICNRCFDGYRLQLPTGNSSLLRCEKCDDNCLRCDDDRKNCTVCAPGYQPNSAGACAPITLHCSQQDANLQLCMTCEYGYTPVNGICVKCFDSATGVSDCPANCTQVNFPNSNIRHTQARMFDLDTKKSYNFTEYPQKAFNQTYNGPTEAQSSGRRRLLRAHEGSDEINDIF